MTLKLILGVVLFSMSLLVIILNCLICIPVFRLAFVAKKSTVYVIAFFNILSDFCHLTIICFYLSVSMIADRFIFWGDRLHTWAIIVGLFYINAWYMECCVQMLMAVNRFTVITLNKHNIFTFKTTLLIFVFVISATLFSASCNQFFFPCCQFILDQDLMTIIFVEHDNLYSYSNLMNLLYSLICSVIAIFCYIAIFITIRKAPKVAATNSAHKNNHHHQELRYVIQFVLVTVFYITAWVLFEILPFIVPANRGEYYVVVPILVVMNCSTNAIIYLSMNREVQKELTFYWIRVKVATVMVTSQANQNNSNNFVLTI